MSKAMVIKAGIDAAVNELFSELDQAQGRGDGVAADTANAEIDRLLQIASKLQFAINHGLIVRLDAIADRIEASIQRQTASGLFRAATILANTVRSTTGRVIQVPRPGAAGPPTAPPAAPPSSPPAPQPPATPPGLPVPYPNTIRARPGPLQPLIDAIIQRADTLALDPVAVLTIVAIESNFDPQATNPNSSAAGLFQFIDSTWLAAGGERFPDRGGKGNGHAAGASVKVQIVIGCHHTARNREQLEQLLGQPPTTTQLYMAHQQGLRGARQILQADRNSPIESAIGAEPARLNRLDGLSVAEAIARFGKLVAKHTLEVRELIEQPSDPTPRLPPLGDSDDFRDSVAEIARTELTTFAVDLDGEVVKERQEPLRSRALEYFRFVGKDEVSDPGKVPWSAAFISFVMAQAGAERRQFPFSAAHSRYILKALQNRLDGKLDATLVYHDRSEFAPRVGDLVGRSRSTRVKNRKDMEKLLPRGHFAAHTDVVVQVKPGYIETIGGNVGNSIKKRRFETTASGLVKDRKKWFFVLEVNIQA